MGKRLLRGLMLTLALLLLGGCAPREETPLVLEPRRTSAPPTPAVRESDDSELAGDWYGWWRIYHTSGDWEKMYGYYWDCCAQIGGDGAFLLWSEELPKDDCLAETRVEYSGGDFHCVGGSMLERPNEPENWALALTEDEYGRLLTVRGRYEAVKSEGAFSYEILLRPWGARWPEQKDSRPYFYEDWYLPLIEKGAAMPDTIGA